MLAAEYDGDPAAVITNSIPSNHEGANRHAR